MKPDDAAAFYNRGNAWGIKGEYDKAIADFTEAIRLKPDDAAAFFYRGLAWGNKREYDKAIADYTEAIRLKPDYAFAFNNRGNAWWHLGDYDRAIADHTEAIRLKPERAAAFNNRGVAWAYKGEYDKALEDFSQALRLDKALALPWANRGKLFLKRKTRRDLEQSIADSEQALRLDPKLADARSNLEEAQRALQALIEQARAPATGARVALVIGNSNYLAAPLLPNARNDAQDIAAELKKLGYRIYGYPKTDFSKAELEQEIEAFKQASIGASAAVLWYSGHGQQMLEDGAELPNDYVIPVDGRINKGADVTKNAIRLERLQTAVLAAKQLRLLVIDACRNNPFYTGARAARGMGRPSAAPGVLLVQSTATGNIAQDGEGRRNSPFAESFLQELRRAPDRDLRLLFSAVQGGTMSLTRNEQRPEITDNLASGEVVLLRGAKAP